MPTRGESFGLVSHLTDNKVCDKESEGNADMYITKDTTIAEIVYQYPELIEPLHEIGLYCFS